MIRFTVVMHPLAERELTELWLEAPDRSTVSDAANGIERELAVDAHLKGRRVSARTREISWPPLHCLFRVQMNDRIAEVFSVTRDS